LPQIEFRSVIYYLHINIIVACLSGEREITMNKNIVIAALLAALPSASVFACASCGCSLSSDWDSQGVSSSKGWKLDLRYDYLNQNEYRHGTSKVAYDPATGQENETYTKNQYFTAGLDYAYNPNWGVTLQLPFIDRQHETKGVPGDPDFGQASVQDTKKIGDIKLIGRYQGFADSKNFGIQFGIKLATGSHTETFGSGPAAGVQVDPGLQPGTGSTDLILGAYYFDSISRDWDYFVQGVAQATLHNDGVYQPGNSLNLNFGVRYMAFDRIYPQLQINSRFISRDQISTVTDAMGNLAYGPLENDKNTGGRIVYLSPGASFSVSESVKVFAFVQLPIHQNLNGYQLAPKYTASLGARFAF
jgi:hypothetical protein